MATGQIATRPGGFPVKTASQTLTSTQKRQAARNLTPPVIVVTGDATIGPEPGIYVFTKGSAAAITLTAPVETVDDGVCIQLIAGSAFAHVVTCTDGLNDGVTGGAKDKITLGAYVGAAAEFIAYAATWMLTNKTVGTVAAN